MPKSAVGIKAPFPGFIEPALATSIERSPRGDRWIHEIKFDGYRVQVHVSNAQVKVFTRRGNDWTKRFDKVASDAWHIAAGSAIIDGEVVAPADDGTTDFSVLQNDLKGRSTKIVLVAFDLLYLNGRDLRQLPLHQRKALLKSVVAETDVQFSESFEVDGPEMFKHACKTGLEGVVSKVRDSRYPHGRSNDWVKVTCRQRETLPIAGFAMKANRFDGIFIGRRRGDELIYAGKVDHGFTPDDANELQDRLKPLVRKSQPYKKRIAHKGVWVSQRCWRKWNTARSQRKGSYGIRFSRECVMTCNGTVPNVWVYQGKELKVFASAEAAQEWFDQNDPEGVAFKCEVEGKQFEPMPSIAPGC